MDIKVEKWELVCNQGRDPGKVSLSADAGCELVFFKILRLCLSWGFFVLFLIFFKYCIKILFILITEFFGTLKFYIQGRHLTCFPLILTLLSITMPTSVLLHYSALRLVKYSAHSDFWMQKEIYNLCEYNVRF